MTLAIAVKYPYGNLANALISLSRLRRVQYKQAIIFITDSRWSYDNPERYEDIGAKVFTIDNSTVPNELIEIPQLLDETKNFSIGLDNFSYTSLTLEENTHIEVSGEFSMGYWSEFGKYVIPKIWVDEETGNIGRRGKLARMIYMTAKNATFV